MAELDHRQAPQRRRSAPSTLDVPERVPALHVLRRRRGALRVSAELPRRPLRRLRLRSTTRRRATRARRAAAAPQRDRARASARSARRRASRKRYRGRRFDRAPVDARSTRRRARGARATSTRLDEQPRRRPRPLVHGRRRHRQDDARDARLQGRARAPAASVAIYSLPRLLGRAPRHLRRRRRATRYIDAARPPRAPSTCCTSTTSAPSRRPTWVLEQLYTIVNARYEDERAIVLTTNLDPTTSCASRSASARSRGCTRCAATRCR